jgi:hypothetical protein
MIKGCSRTGGQHQEHLGMYAGGGALDTLWLRASSGRMLQPRAAMHVVVAVCKRCQGS